MGIGDNLYEHHGDSAGNGQLTNGNNVINVIGDHIASSLMIWLHYQSAGPDLTVSVNGISFTQIEKIFLGLGQSWYYLFQGVQGPRVSDGGTYTISVAGIDTEEEPVPLTENWQMAGPWPYCPYVSRAGYTGLTDTSVTIKGDLHVEVDTRENYSYGIHWDLSEPPITHSTTDISDSDIMGFEEPLSGLTPNTTYYYRFYASYSLGTVYDPPLDESALQFTTKSAISAYDMMPQII